MLKSFELSASYAAFEATLWLLLLGMRIEGPISPAGNRPVNKVNATGQFLVLAQMVGAVDFDRSIEYWQQDKWTGCFPVKWHFVKDVPNSMLRHITLENNENKLVTNSRDTQEVRLEQGVEIIKIFKSHSNKTSIFDDFEFYESRERAMLEKNAKQKQFNKQIGDEVALGIDKDGLISKQGSQISIIAKMDAIEINFSCPHGMPERKMGATVGPDCALLEEVCRWINEKATVPVWAKMTPNITDITQVGLLSIPLGYKVQDLDKFITTIKGARLVVIHTEGCKSIRPKHGYVILNDINFQVKFNNGNAVVGRI